MLYWVEIDLGLDDQPVWLLLTLRVGWHQLLEVVGEVVGFATFDSSAVGMNADSDGYFGDGSD